MFRAHKTFLSLTFTRQHKSFTIIANTDTARISGAGQPVLRIAFDFGTSKNAVATHIAIPGQNFNETDVRDVIFKANFTTAPQQIALHRDKIIWGYKLQTMLKRSQIEHEKVISFLKVAFYKNYAESSLVKQAMEKVEPLKEVLIKEHPEWEVYDAKVLLLAKQIESIVEFTRRELESRVNTKIQYTEGTIKDLPVELFISVPGMWLPPGNRSILEAAHLAGFSKVELVWEPQTTAAFYVHNLAPRAGVLVAHNEILIFDAGGGTSNLVLYELQTDDNTGVEL
ncbi:hypothetical protein CKM354_000663500 [Cercospora kikuchii]|uniref:Uncharacterized protein n=1 Tax=Cercospora kikuchii TaxID=84275 RepID=A0A9P3CHP1_9PEZI|nr:uncharacterized protein CKM354_000663500 [Cercospora kikuchii]GIZ43407.1 hypothetical protein CKM354_000663500 [Cercospora kikuchii]